jgi:hypothetical protein
MRAIYAIKHDARSRTKRYIAGFQNSYSDFWQVRRAVDHQAYRLDIPLLGTVERGEARESRRRAVATGRRSSGA